MLALWATSQIRLFRTVCDRLYAITNLRKPLSFPARALPWWGSSTVVTTNAVFPWHDLLDHNWYKHLVQGELATHSSSSGFIHSVYSSLFESAGRHLSGLHYVLTTRSPIKSFYQEVLSCVLCIFFTGTLVDVGSSTSCCHPSGWWYSWGVSESSWGQREQRTEAAQTRDGGSERSRLRADVNQENDNLAMVTNQVPETFQASRV